MSAPRAVKKGLEQAEAIRKQMYPDQPPVEGDGSRGAEPQNPEPTEPRGADPNNGSPQPNPQPPEPQAPDPAAQPQEDWEKRFKSLKKDYDTNVHRLRSELGDISSKLDEVMAENRRLREAGQQPAEPEVVISEEDRERFGEDLISLIGKVSKVDLGKQLLSLQARIEQLEGATQKTVKSVQEKAKADYYSYLDANVKNWRETNQDQRFLAWLDEVAPLTGRPRMAFLGEAAKAFDGPAVAEFFLEWERSQAPRKQEPQQRVQPDPARGGNGLPPGAPSSNADIWDGERINQFYHDKRAGKYTTERAREIEESITQAYREGRVV